MAHFSPRGQQTCVLPLLQHERLFGQQPALPQQRVVRLSQHLRRHSSWLGAQRLQSPVEGFAHRQFFGQHFDGTAPRATLGAALHANGLRRGPETGPEALLVRVAADAPAALLPVLAAQPKRPVRAELIRLAARRTARLRALAGALADGGVAAPHVGWTARLLARRPTGAAGRELAADVSGSAAVAVAAGEEIATADLREQRVRAGSRIAARGRPERGRSGAPAPRARQRDCHGDKRATDHPQRARPRHRPRHRARELVEELAQAVARPRVGATPPPAPLPTKLTDRIARGNGVGGSVLRACVLPLSEPPAPSAALL